MSNYKDILREMEYDNPRKFKTLMTRFRVKGIDDYLGVIRMMQGNKILSGDEVLILVNDYGT